MKAADAHRKDLVADILTGIIDGVIVTDIDGGILIWNRAAEELTGIAAADAFGRAVTDLLSDNPAVVGQIEKTVSSGRSYSDYEAELTQKYGPPHPVAIVTSLLRDDEGGPVGVIVTIRDQTGIRDLKERIRRSDRLAALGLIAAGIAHEVKNPLVGIRGAAQLMKSDLQAGGMELPASCRSLTEYLDVILKESDRLNKVLEGILDFTRVKPRERKASNIHSVLDRALLLNEESARQCGIVLTRLYDPSLPDAFVSEDQLIQVFLNIIKNAIEVMPSGGKLTVLTRMSDMFTTVQADGKKRQLMVVKVSDTGAGIKQEHLDGIFTPFFTTKDRGVGLGLALSYQIVQEHLGTIRVESREKEGTTFSVYLPLAGS
jgi:two-component system, NtrC family, nitrogen regulation sensor histidine kinase GlnL